MTFEEDTGEAEAPSTDNLFLVDVDGFEGPLDLLLDLARRQKIDLQRVSVLALAEQYLAFIAAARDLRLELAADYLVMAAWLALLKSRLLLPRSARPDEPDPGDLAQALAERLCRLDRIRTAARALEDRPRVGRDLALRGMCESTVSGSQPALYAATIYDLMAAYARQRQRQALSRVILTRRRVMSLPDAREALIRLVGRAAGWHELDDLLPHVVAEPTLRRSARASIFAVALELVRDGRIAMRQDEAFATIRVAPRGATA